MGYQENRREIGSHSSISCSTCDPARHRLVLLVLLCIMANLELLDSSFTVHIFYGLYGHISLLDVRETQATNRCIPYRLSVLSGSRDSVFESSTLRFLLDVDVLPPMMGLKGRLKMLAVQSLNYGKDCYHVILGLITSIPLGLAIQ
ncbi:hypothetical protein IFM89_000422 [Coptis chinensis]|uniref:Uncharacterized protein n=1 Tax=Coptis chinensis TaxID=261450 RepID=A0A835I4M1_9MAGN|nr:hypothetical protein IFM89_000422 [Coptis chinensis]